MNYKIFSSSNKNYKLLQHNSNYCNNFFQVRWKKNNFSKIRYYLKSLKQLENNTFVILIDASDVICINNDIEEFYEKFKSFNKPIVFGTECGGGYVFSKEQENLNAFNKIFNLKTPSFKHAYRRKWLKDHSMLNSGLICGYSDNLIELFNKVIYLHPNGRSDQNCIILTIIKTPSLSSSIALDFDSILFHNFSVFKDNYKIDSNKKDKSFQYNNKTLSPFFIHFPGLSFANQKSILNKMLHKLNLYKYYYS